MRAIVIGPAEIPLITDLEQACALPELAVLSVAAHGHAPGAEQIARAALKACAALDEDHQALHADFVMASLLPEVRHALESDMYTDIDLDRFLPQSDVGKHFFARGQEVGMRTGKKLGRQEALRSLLVTLLTQRFGALPEAAMTRIQSADAELLAHWGERLLAAASLAAVLDSAP